MSVIDEVVAANEHYAQSFKLGDLPMPPARRLAMLGIKTGEAHIIRNAGGIVTEDALRSLIISHELLGTEEFMIINHTDCGMLTFKDEALADRLQQSTGAYPVVPATFHAFQDVGENVRRQILRLRTHPWVAKDIAVRGFVYDVTTGRLREVAAEKARTA